MANILSLALKINADASGFRLDPVQRALIGLGDQADKLNGAFAKFAGSSEAAARAQERTAAQSQALINGLRDGTISSTQFAAQFERLTESVNAEAAAFERAARITEQNLSQFERFERQAAELREQLDAGRITQETYNRALEGASKGLTDAERAAAGLAARTEEVAAAGDESTLKFNELSGIFAVLPGPLGNIAGRISGIASASEGLTRIFAGGLQSGITNLVGSFTALVNPVTLGLAAITAFAAGATAVARGLTSLEDRVEKLGNIAAKLGVSFGFIQTLEESARRSGTSIDAVSAAFGRLQKSVLGVDEESKAAQKALQELGVTSEQLAALSPEEQYQLIGKALAGIEDPARRTATATALFGKAGADLLPFFRNLPGAANDIERFGRTLSDLDKRRIDEFGSALDSLAVAGQGLGQSLLVPFTGLGEGIASALAEITAGITAIVDPIGRILEPVLTQVGRVIELIGTGVGNLGRTIGAVFEPFAVIVETLSAAFEPLLDGILTFLQNISNAGASTAEWLISFTPIGAIAANIEALGETVGRVVTIIVTAFQRVGEFVSGLASRFGELVAQSPFLQTLGDIISSVFGGVASVFQTIASAIGGVVGRLLTLAENFLGIDRSAQQAAESAATVGTSIERTAEETKALEKAYADSNKGLDTAIQKAGEFGQAGFNAAYEFEQSLKDLKEQADNNELNAEQYTRGVALATAEYEKQIEAAKLVADENKRLAEEAQRRAKAEADAIQGIIDKSLEQLRIDQEFGGDSERAKAADNLLKIQQEIVRVEEQIRQAREAGDQDAIAKLTSRLATLDQVAAREDDIASGAAKAREDAAKAAEKAAKEAERLAKQRADAEAKIREKIAEKEQQFFERQTEIRAEQLAELATPQAGSVKIGDLRESGISAFFATLQEDPAIVEAKKQRAELEKIRKEIAKLQAEKVDILGGGVA